MLFNFPDTFSLSSNNRELLFQSSNTFQVRGSYSCTGYRQWERDGGAETEEDLGGEHVPPSQQRGAGDGDQEAQQGHVEEEQL